MSKSGHTEYDVIVVGSGPAGMSTAMHLTKLIPSIQHRMVVLEKTRHPRSKICGGGIGASADYWLKRLDIRMSIPSLELNRIRIIMDHDRYTEYVVLDDALFRTVMREEFDEALVEKARTLGIEVAQNEPAVSLSCKDDTVVVETPKRNLTTKILVGADGAKSMIRQKLYRKSQTGGPRTTCSTLRLMEQVDTDCPEHRDMEAVIDFTQTFRHGIPGYAWSLPVINQGQTWLNIGVCNFRISSDKGCSLRQLLREFLPSRGVSMDESRLDSHPIRWFHPSSILSATRVLLVGDAAGIDPLWGEGISFSLGYGHLAANSILRALNLEDFSFPTYKEELLEHQVGQGLMSRLKLADKLYGSPKPDNVRDLIMSVLWPR